MSLPDEPNRTRPISSSRFFWFGVTSFDLRKINVRVFGLCLWPCWEARAVHTCIRAAAALATRAVTTPVHSISKNNALSGHILPNYAASLRYAFSADIIREGLSSTSHDFAIFAGDSNKQGKIATCLACIANANQRIGFFP